MPADMNDYFKKKKPSGGGANNSNRPNMGSNGGGGNGGSNFENPLSNLGKGGPWIIAIVVIAFAIFAFKPFTIINEGEIGIKVSMGKFQEDPLRAGFHIILPVIQEIIPVSIKTRQIVYSNTKSTYIGDRQSKSLMGQNYSSDIKRASAITVKDKRNLKVDIDISIQYKLKPQSAPDTIANYGMSWEENLINPTVRSVVRDVLGQYIAEETAEKRTEINHKIKSMIEKAINSHEGKPVTLVAVDLRNINLPENVQNSINDVQMAEQQKKKSYY
ncbi:MAG: prohibitin family protein [Sulfurovum sp.]|nr:prohibitin family protein [Sulfurovum sp.]